MTCPFGSILRGITGSAGLRDDDDADGLLGTAAAPDDSTVPLSATCLTAEALLRFFFAVLCAVFCVGTRALFLDFVVWTSGGFQTSV